MVIVIDANILISSCLKIKGRIAELILNTSSVSFTAPEFVLTEIKENELKICKTGQSSRPEFNANLQSLLPNIVFVNDKEISDVIYKKSFDLVSDIDLKDIIYVAVAISLDGLLWTGDLKLLRGLKRKGFNAIITTKDFEQILKGL